MAGKNLPLSYWKGAPMKKFLILLAVLALVLLAIVLVRTLDYPSKQMAVPQAPAPLQLDEGRAVETLQMALRLPTISHQDRAKMDGEKFKELHRILETAYPKVHAQLRKEALSDYSLLYTWEGKDPRQKPIILMAHQDVVPIEAPGDWDHPPFAAEIVDGFLYGRGALDDKSSVTAILEAAEALLAEGFTPERTLYLAFGHDEEVGGWEGAAKIVETLKSRGVRAELSLDEGMAVVEGVLPGVAKPIALIGLSEKGYLTLELTAKAPGGHSSQPPQQTALGILGRAVAQLEENPMHASLRGPMREMFDYAGPEMPFLMRAVFANLWLFGGLVERQLLAQRTTAAALRTTTAVTIIEGGSKENVLPTSARAVVNFRLMPDDSIQDVIGHVKKVIGDERVSVEILGKANEAPPLAKVDCPAYEALNKTIRQIFPEVLVVPSMMLGGSDSHHYGEVAENSYRFGPLWLTGDDVDSIHGANERIAKDDYLRAIRFFAQFIRNTSA